MVTLTDTYKFVDCIEISFLVTFSFEALLFHLLTDRIWKYISNVYGFTVVSVVTSIGIWSQIIVQRFFVLFFVFGWKNVVFFVLVFVYGRKSFCIFRHSYFSAINEKYLRSASSAHYLNFKNPRLVLKRFDL